MGELSFVAFLNVFLIRVKTTRTTVCVGFPRPPPLVPLWVSLKYFKMCLYTWNICKLSSDHIKLKKKLLSSTCYYKKIRKCKFIELIWLHTSDPFQRGRFKIISEFLPVYGGPRDMFYPPPSKGTFVNHF